MLSLIESYGDEEVVIDGADYPAPALLEDEDGIRWMLVAGELIPPGSWARATAGGAAGVARPVESDGWAIASTEYAMEHRTEAAGYFTLDRWRQVGAFPTLADLLDAPAPGGQDDLGTFVHLHTHTEYSPLDGVSNLKEVMEAVTSMGQRAVAQTDHGVCAGHPDLQKRADEYGVRPIFGIEAYFVNDKADRSDKDYYHLILLAKDDQGLRNLWAASTESYRDGFYGKPRMDWETLRRHHEGVICLTGCLRGPLSHHALEDGDEEVARQRLGRLLDIFGSDLYAEVQTTKARNPEKPNGQVEVNTALVRIAREYGVPLVVAGDSHYPLKADKHAHKVWLAAAIGKDISAESGLFEGDHDYHLMSEQEVRDALSYLPADAVDEAVANTVRIAGMCDARITKIDEMPIFSKKGGYEADAQLLREMALAAWGKIRFNRYDEQVYRDRFEREFQILVRKRFCGYFLQVADYCRWARSKRILVGPGRGSGAASLIAWLIGITGVDPVEHDFLFERFITEGRTSLPDFDVDFPATKKRDLQSYVRQRYGEENVAIVGSTLRLKNKGIVDRLGKALKSTLPETAFSDLREVSKIIEEAEADTAGLGMAWDDLWDQFGDQLAPYRERYPALFELADRLVGRVHTYGQHAAGMVISAGGDLVSQLPLRLSKEDGELITQFDMVALDELGFVKFDLLTLDTLDVLQIALDLVEQRRGVQVDFDSWEKEFEDPLAWEELCGGHTLGVFQMETSSGTRMAKRMKPVGMDELADATTILRPGPARSGLTEAYLRRRAGDEEVSLPDQRLAQVLSRTFGCIIYQEQVMYVPLLLAGYDSAEADEVRKILGKKKVEKVAAAGQEFISRAVANGADRGSMEQLWAQLAEFAKYSFNRTHAYCYSVISYYTLWMKVHFPVEFLTAVLTRRAETKKLDRLPDFVGEARRKGYGILPPDVNKSTAGFTPSDLAILYGLSAIKGVGPAAVEAVLQGQPYADWDDFMARRGADANAGVLGTLAHIGAFDSMVANRRGLEEMLARQKAKLDTRCALKRPRVDGVADSSMSLCTYDWASEPAPEPRVNERTGKKLKPKKQETPKVCRSAACRRYRPPEVFQISSVRPYSDAEIREIEMQELGVHLTSTPFDDMDPADRSAVLVEAQTLLGGTPPQGVYVLAGTVQRAHQILTRQGEEMAFVDLKTEPGLVSFAVFPKTWRQFCLDLRRGAFLVAEVQQNERGLSLLNCGPVD